MLQPPPLVDPLRHGLLPHTRQIRRMIHPHLHPVGPELLDQRRQQRRTARLRCLSRAPQRVREHAQPQLRVRAHRPAQRLEQLALRLADVQRREEDAPPRGPDPGLQGLVELRGRLDDLDLVAAEVEARGDAVELARQRGQGPDGAWRRDIGVCCRGRGASPSVARVSTGGSSWDPGWSGEGGGAGAGSACAAGTGPGEHDDLDDVRPERLLSVGSIRGINHC